MKSWTNYYLNMTKLVASKSKDPSTKVGCVIVDEDHRVVSTGYNGFPKGIKDTKERLENRELKLKLTIHAEENALLFSDRSLKGHTIYISAPPCSKCVCKIIQKGIVKVIYIKPTKTMIERWGEDFKLAKELLEETGIDYFEEVVDV